MRRSRLGAFMLAASFLFGSPAAAATIPGPLADLQLQLAALSLRAPGHVGIAVKDLTTGATSSVNGSANMPAASTIKIPVMVEVFRQMSFGKIDLNENVTLRRGDKDWGSGDLAGARSGSRYTVSKLLWAMITESDNTATNMLIRLVGRTSINGTMRELGLRSTRLGDYIRSEGNIRSLRSSASDMVRLLEQIAREKLIDEWSCREMIAILTGQRHNGLLPAPLPRGLAIAHKTGTLHDTLNDVGIVYLDSEPYVIAVMTTNLPTLGSGRRFIRSVSKITYDALERFASWRESNGLPSLEPSAAAAPPDVRMWQPASPAERSPADGPEEPPD